MRLHRGFTLVELITVMVITGIVAMMVVNMITTPMQAYSDMKRRAELVDIAELTLQRMARDIHHALPNSVKVLSSGGIKSIAFLNTVDGGRYSSTGSDIFEANQLINKFLIRKALTNITDAEVKADTHYVVVYNLGQTGADAYQGDNIATITGLPLAPPKTEVTFNDFTFPYDSPEDRFMLVDKAVAFICDDLTTKQIRLYSGYNFREDLGGTSVPVDISKGDLLVDNISSCDFKYDPGNSTRPGLVTLEITINDAQHTNEKITLLQQIFVENQP
ncbi:MAG: type II secretion system protein [Gammaproteobacteria bacterium]|nr:type II secretion system protein [Gammaproteobacteria bacterium]